jgi:hypothetical protein
MNSLTYKKKEKTQQNKTRFFMEFLSIFLYKCLLCKYLYMKQLAHLNSCHYFNFIKIKLGL